MVGEGFSHSGGGVEPSRRRAHRRAGTDVRPDFTIRVDWSKPGLQRVGFEGGPDFAKYANYFAAKETLGAGSTLRDMALGFDGFQIPMRIVVAPRHGDGVRFTAATPDDTACGMPAIRLVSEAAPSGTIDERVALLIRARRLIGLCSSYAYELPKLVRKYYEVSCSLAGDRDSFFAIHQDAAERFERLPDTTHKEEVLRDCRGRGTGAALSRDWAEARAALDRRDYAAVSAQADDLLAKAADPKWRDGLGAARLSSQRFRELKVIGLKREQDATARTDPAAAIELNDQLLMLERDVDYAGTFADLGVPKQVLEKDRELFEARDAAAAGPQ